MKIKILDVSSFKINDDICVLLDVNTLSHSDKTLYNQKWIANCESNDEFSKLIELAKILRPKQIFVIGNANETILKGWRGDILKTGDLIELKDKPDEGLILTYAASKIHNEEQEYFELTKRYRIEGREFILCDEQCAYGTVKIGKIEDVEKGWKYFVEHYDAFSEPKFLDEEKTKDQLFIEFIDDCYISDIIYDDYADKAVVDKPYPNEHACRLKSPGQFERFARKNCAQKHNGKCIDVIYGIKAGKTSIQALRYKKSIWSASDARRHCAGRGGSFEAASKDFDDKSVQVQALLFDIDKFKASEALKWAEKHNFKHDTIWKYKDLFYVVDQFAMNECSARGHQMKLADGVRAYYCDRKEGENNE
jgi:hypothetical protein